MPQCNWVTRGDAANLCTSFQTVKLTGIRHQKGPPLFSLYGLTIDSELNLPGLACADGAPNVVIRCAAVPEEMDPPNSRGVCFEAGPGRFLFHLDGVARYRVTEGREITVQRAEGAADEDVRTFLLGTVLSALLYQRGLVPLHASAILTTRGAVLFGGKSGAGKSTLAAAIARRAFPVLTDDVAPIALGADAQPVMYPGSSSLWLWTDALTRLGLQSGNLDRVRPSVDKHVWEPYPARPADPVPLYAYYHLERSNQPSLDRNEVTGIDRVQILGKAVHRPAVGTALMSSASLFGVITTLAQHLRVVQIRRPGTPYLLDQLVDLVLSDLDDSELPPPSR